MQSLLPRCRRDLKTRALSALGDLADLVTLLRESERAATGAAADLDSIAKTGLGEVRATVDTFATSLAAMAHGLAASAKSLLDIARDLADAGFADLEREFAHLNITMARQARAITDRIDGGLAGIGHAVDPIVSAATAWLDLLLSDLLDDLRKLYGTIDPVLEDVQAALDVVAEALSPAALLETVIIGAVIRPLLEDLLRPFDGLTDENLKLVRERLQMVAEIAGDRLGKLTVDVLENVDYISDVCAAVFEGADKVVGYIDGLSTDANGYIKAQVDELERRYQPLVDGIRDAMADVGEFERRAASLLATVKAFDHSVRGLQNDLSRSIETARMYGDRVFDAVGRLDDGGVLALPSNVLKLYSAVSSAPEIAALKADIDRIRAGFDELGNIIETTEASALFNRLGDELKALGLTLPFDRIEDRLLPTDLGNFDIGKIFGNFGGLNLDSLFKGYRMPAGLRDAVRVTHDFDKGQGRVWVQVDVNAPMPGRRSLFTLGVFQVDFVDMTLTGKVRLEASKDQDTVTQTGVGRIDTTIDLLVSGQSMVRFDKFALNFTREQGLKIDFDPKNIHLNPAFKFIQDFLAKLFPEKVGGLKIVKQDNIPVGIEHDFVLPPMTLNFGTSGVSNIAIENHFKLLAFPDFMLANRFNLSTADRPFIFSIFVIGGTGYIQIDAEYRPFDSQLMVAVEAAAGGSAALAFAVGPFVGQVFITLSGAMTYRKMIGKPGGGLSIAVVLVIAGHVQVAGIVTVGITLMLRMNYRDNGEINGEGTLAVTIRISRFFKLTARANVNYKLRGGKSETSVSTSASGTITDDRLKKAEQAVAQLKNASK